MNIAANMKRMTTIMVMLSCLLTLHCAQASDQLSTLLPKVMPAVVNISTHGKTFWRGHTPKKTSGLASGVIIDAQKGYVVTNAHAVHDANTIIVTLNNKRQYIAHLIGVDRATDLAVLKIPSKHLKALPFSKNKIDIGQSIVAIGNPFGLSQSVTSGIVSALHRQIGIEGLENFIQIDASINPGNSGGALINERGELVGINTAILSPSKGNVGIGFAIPLSIVEPIVQQLIKHHNVKRGVLGVMAQNLSPTLQDALRIKSKQGAIITEVVPNSTAEKLGLKPFDVIVRINDFAITDAAEVRSQVGVTRFNTPIKITYLRNNTLKHTSGKLQNIPEPKTNETLHRVLTEGMSLTAVDALTANNKRVKGLMVDAIEHGTHPWLSGLHVGDIILSVDQHDVQTLDGFIERLNHQDTKKPILLAILRHQQQFFIALD